MAGPAKTPDARPDVRAYGGLNVDLKAKMSHDSRRTLSLLRLPPKYASPLGDRR